MGEKEATGSTSSLLYSKFSNPMISKSSKLCYTRNFLLLFADNGTCKRRPEGLDCMLWRDSPSFEVVDGGVANPLPTVRTVVRRDRESEVGSKLPQDVPEWRKDSWRPGSSGSCGSGGVQQGVRRRSYDDEVGSNVSASYPPKPAANWGDNCNVRSLDRSALSSGCGQGRWEHRQAAGDRDRERRSVQDLESDDPDVGNRFIGAASTHSRSGLVPPEGDGLLGSGGISRGAFTCGLTGQPLRHNGSGRNRSIDQYQSPKQMKLSSNLRRDETDFINDETFGFDESTSEERVEQERKRRESFELMRKQHHRHHQELKEKCLSAEPKTMKRNEESSLWDNQSCMDAGTGSTAKTHGRLIGFTSESSAGALPTSVIRTQISAHSSTPRPAVPPGFTKASHSRALGEAGHDDIIFSSEAMDNCCAPIKDAGSELDSSGLQKAFHVHIGSDRSELRGVCGGIEVVSSETLETVNTVTATHVLMPGDNQVVDSWDSRIVDQSESKSRELRNPCLEKYASEAHTSSQNEVLVQYKEAERISVSVSVEDNISVVEDSWSNDLQVSNIAQWFYTEDIGAPESSQLKQVPFKSLKMKHQSLVLPMPAGLSLEDVEKGIAATHKDDESSRNFSPFGKVTPAAHIVDVKDSQCPGPGQPSGVLTKCPVFLTCEDIEFSIIAEADRNMENNMSPIPSQPASVQSLRDGTDVGPSTNNEAGKASQLLMSLLRRQPLPDQTGSSSMSPKEMVVEEREQVGGKEDLSKVELVDWVPGDYALGHVSLQPEIAREFPTLELLFGKAFMNELRAQDKPVSMKNYPHPVQVGEQQLPFAVSSSRLSEAGSSFSSKPSFDSAGSMLDLTGSDARDVVIADLPRKPAILSSEQDIILVSTDTEELWPNSYALPEHGASRRILSDSSGMIIRSHDTENESKTCSTEGIFDKINDGTNGVVNHANSVGQAFSESDFGEANGVSMENLVTRTGLSLCEARSVSVPENKIGTVPSESANCFGAIRKGADHSGAITRDPLPSVDHSAFQDGGVVKSTSALGLVFSMEKSFDGSATEGLPDTLITKARMREVMSRPEVSAGYVGGHHPQHRSTASAQLEGTAIQSHQSVAYSGFQPQPLQQTQGGLPMPVLYRPLSPSIVGLRSHPSPVHHQLQQPLMSQGITPIGYSGFSHVPYRPPQPQQLLPHFGRGAGMEFPQFGFGPAPENRGRSFSQHGSASGLSHFQPPPGHIGQQGTYHHMRPVGPIPNQFIGAAHLPQRGPFYQVMNRGPFIHDHSLHEPVTLAAKHGLPATSIFSMNGPSLHSGPSSMIPQPGHNGRAQLLGPHLVGHPSTLGFFSGSHCVSDVGYADKGQELSCHPNNGSAVGSSGVDRWFSMDSSCAFPAKPGHGLMH